jgi:hypothetical protein
MCQRGEHLTGSHRHLEDVVVTGDISAFEGTPPCLRLGEGGRHVVDAGQAVV